jgi:hypothetical protein
MRILPRMLTLREFGAVHDRATHDVELDEGNPDAVPPGVHA